MPIVKPIVSLISRSFDISGADAGVLLADAAENGACYLKTDGNEPVSVALSKPVRLRINGEERKGEYLFGVCTDAAHRGRGYAAGLVAEACENADADCAVLIPENEGLFEFYGPLGFTAAGACASFSVEASAAESVSVSGDGAYTEYLGFAQKCDNLCILSERDFISSAALAPRTAVVGKSGVCFITSDGSVEVFAPRERIKDLAASALSLLGISAASVTTHFDFAPDGAAVKRIGMIKPLRNADIPARFYINNLYNL